MHNTGYSALAKKPTTPYPKRYIELNISSDAAFAPSSNPL
jgi:hypothetical protein